MVLWEPVAGPVVMLKTRRIHVTGERVRKRGPVHLMLIWDLRMSHGEKFVEVRRRNDFLSTEEMSDIDFRFGEIL